MFYVEKSYLKSNGYTQLSNSGGMHRATIASGYYRSLTYYETDSGKIVDRHADLSQFLLFLWPVILISR